MSRYDPGKNDIVNDDLPLVLQEYVNNTGIAVKHTQVGHHDGKRWMQNAEGQSGQEVEAMIYEILEHVCIICASCRRLRTYVGPLMKACVRRHRLGNVGKSPVAVLFANVRTIILALYDSHSFSSLKASPRDLLRKSRLDLKDECNKPHDLMMGYASAMGFPTSVCNETEDGNR